jgi:mono/diheme cytochrome c family protein
MIFRSVSASVLLLAQLVSAQPTVAADVQHGEIIAKRWCAACHVVSAEQKSASADVPSFADIARRRKSRKALAAFLTDPHPKMPNMNLSRAEIDDIVAYIRSLDPKAQPSAPDGAKEETLPKKG